MRKPIEDSVRFALRGAGFRRWIASLLSTLQPSLRNGRIARAGGVALLLTALAPAVNAQPIGESTDPAVDTIAPAVVSTSFTDSVATLLPGINSADRDDTPLISADQRVLFFNSTRHASRPWARRMSRDRYDDDIYFTVHLDDSSGIEWSAPVNLSSVNTGEDDGVAAISPSGNTIYLLSLRQGWEKNDGPFYQGNLDGTEVGEIRGVGGGITKFFSEHGRFASIRIYGASVDPYAKAFYFATTVGSKTGDHEIWISRRNSDDEPWGYPENLGPAINAGGGSYSPLIAFDGRTLYFASGRSGGLGGDDIYMTFLEDDGTWREPANLGAPVNSTANDAFLTLPASGELVYFSSSRSGNDDIYVSSLRQEFRPTGVVLMAGTILDDRTGEPIEATITIQDLVTGKKIFESRSNSVDGRYATILTPGGRYGISVSAPGYVFVSENYDVPAGILYSEITRDYRLEQPQARQRFTLENIFFDLRLATLRPESDLELARLAGFLKERPGARIEVGGHTDSTGSIPFNMELSEERARTVKEHLVSKHGIDPARIEIRGYGPTRPVETNTTDEGRQKNRRVEFTIITIGKNEE